jgi:outer membrane receptor protein involved in Fe transport
VIGGDFADGRGNATVYASWRKNNELLQEARDYSSCALSPEGNWCGGSGTAEIPNFFIAPLTDDGEGPYGFDFTQSTFLTLQTDSSLAPFAGNFHNYNPVNSYQRPDERWSAGAFIDFEINEHAVAYLEVMLANDETAGKIAESGTFFYEPYPLPVSNALFPDNFAASLQELYPGEDEFGIYIGKRNTEGGPRSDVLTHSSFRVVAGVKGSISESWNYDISYLHAQTSSNSTYINDFLAPSLFTAVNAELCAATAGCIPYEVFTYQGVTAAAAASVGGTASAQNQASTDVFNAYVAGTLPWGLPAGEIMAVAGYEWRQQAYQTLADTLYQEGLLLGKGLITPSIGGVYRVNELFAEANVPLLADKSWARQMTLDLAYRWSDYSTSVTTSTYRVGLDWQVFDAVRIRTGYNRAVRTPNVNELFQPQDRRRWGGVDPCEGETPDYTAAQCALTGVTAAQYGNIQVNPFGVYNSIVGGNPDLDPETADTFTFGVVVDPMDAMQFSIDYWEIKIMDVIGRIAPATTIDQCALFGNFCENIHRSGSGSLWFGRQAWVLDAGVNISEQHWQGIDLAWNWALDAWAGNWNFDLLGTYTLKKETTQIANDPDSSFDCQGVISRDCFPNPKWRHTASATYDSNSFWAATARWRYYGKVKYEGTTDLIANDNLGAHNYIDLNGVFRFMETHDVVVGVNNVFDKEPPLLGDTLSTNGNTAAGFYDTLGRYFFANLTLRW